MFDIGWGELVLVGLVALIVIGPKELPTVLRTAGQWMGKVKRMASEFQGQFQEALREAEVADLKESDLTGSLKGITDYDPLADIDNDKEKEDGSSEWDEPSFETPEHEAPAAESVRPNPLKPNRAGSAGRRGRIGAASKSFPKSSRRSSRRRRSRPPRTSRRPRHRRLSRRGAAHEHDDIEATKAPLMDHLIELRSRLIKAVLAFAVTFGLCFVFAKDIYNVLVWPFVWVAGPEHSKFIYTALLEYFITQLKLAMFGAAFLSFPVVAGQIYMFVAPGLYKHERKAFLPYLVATPIFFVVGAMVVYFLVFPMLVRFSLHMQQPGGAGDAHHRADAQGRRISVADDVAGAGLRRRLPTAGDPDAARPHRHRHLGPAQGEAQIRHRRRLHRSPPC